MNKGLSRVSNIKFKMERFTHVIPGVAFDCANPAIANAKNGL